MNTLGISKHQLNPHDVSEYRAWPWGFKSQRPSLNCRRLGEEHTRRGSCQDLSSGAQPGVEAGRGKLSWGREAETRAAFARRGKRCVSGVRVASVVGRGGDRGWGGLWDWGWAAVPGKSTCALTKTAEFPQTDWTSGRQTPGFHLLRAFPWEDSPL